MRLFDTEYMFFVLHLLHVILIEVAAYMVLYYLGTDWPQYILAIFIMAVSQVSRVILIGRLHG